jgi:REP element-mobilizing transposase RayT
MKELKPYYRRRLPHYQPKDSILFATFRLTNSLPKEIIAQLHQERDEREKEIQKESNLEKRLSLIEEEQRRYFGHFDSYLDRISTEIRWLENANIAKLVYDAILFYNTTEYDVIAFCIMPNHVHLVADMKHKNVPLHNILKRIKTFTALKSNLILNRSRQFWQNENYDHVVRDGNELTRIITYVIENPVKAGLCKKWEDWKWTYVDMKYLEY